MQLDDSILITGGKGLVGAALRAALDRHGYRAVNAPTSAEVDLSDPRSASSLIEDLKPRYVFHLAGAVFGLGGNLKDPSHTYLKNCLINTNVVEACRKIGVKKVLGMGSICAYPAKLGAETVLTEDRLFDGIPHAGELAYGHTKRGLLVHLQSCQQSSGMDYAFALSTNLYGPNDRFNIQNGHVIPSLIRKFFVGAQEKTPIEVWGDGSSKRDFMHCDDAAEALIAIMKTHRGPINLATGEMTSIGEVVEALAAHTNCRELVRYLPDMPRGHEFVGLDVSKLRELGFRPGRTFAQGVRDTFDWYSKNHDTARH